MLTRRQATGALIAAAALPAIARAATPLVQPPRLRPGDTVGLIEPAFFTPNPYDLRFVEETIRAMGLVPKPAAHLRDRFGYLAGTDADRAADVNAMYADDTVKAVFAVRGGWGCARLLPYLDFRTIARHPKLLIGFSDITALHLAFAAKAGFTTIHGPNAGSGWGKESWEPFRALVFDGATPTYANPAAHDDRLAQRAWRTRTIRGGRAQGRLLGGNLSVLATLVGTPYLPDFKGAILFLEDVEEAEYRIDRMLTQLSLAGILRQVAGVVFGQCTDCKADGASYGGFTLSEVLQQRLEPLGVPVFQGAAFGHIANQFSLPVGARAEIDADAGHDPDTGAGGGVGGSRNDPIRNRCGCFLPDLTGLATAPSARLPGPPMAKGGRGGKIRGGGAEGPSCHGGCGRYGRSIPRAGRSRSVVALCALASPNRVPGRGRYRPLFRPDYRSQPVSPTGSDRPVRCPSDPPRIARLPSSRPARWR